MVFDRLRAQIFIERFPQGLTLCVGQLHFDFRAQNPVIKADIFTFTHRKNIAVAIIFRPAAVGVVFAFTFRHFNLFKRCVENLVKLSLIVIALVEILQFGKERVADAVIIALDFLAVFQHIHNADGHGADAVIPFVEHCRFRAADTDQFFVEIADEVDVLFGLVFPVRHNVRRF